MYGYDNFDFNYGLCERGEMSYNKKGECRNTGRTHFKVGQNANELNHKWKGENASYSAKHYWVNRKLGKPRECSSCGTKKAKKYEWANLSGEYKRDLADYIRLCVSCHRRMDGHGYKAWETRRVYV